MARNQGIYTSKLVFESVDGFKSDDSRDPRYRIFLGDMHFLLSIFGLFACHLSTNASGAEGWVILVRVCCSRRLKLGF